MKGNFHVRFLEGKGRAISLLLFALICSYNAVAQKKCTFPVDIEKITRNHIYSGNGNAMDFEKDTLRLENGEKFVLKQTPLIFFDGYSKLFSNYKDVVVFIKTGQKGFICTWVIRNGDLYLDKIYFGITLGDSINSGDLLPTKKVQQENIEVLTGQKYNSQGLLPANWMSGVFGGFGLIPDSYRDSLQSINYKKEYVFSFAKGKLEYVKLYKKEMIDILNTELNQ